MNLFLIHHTTITIIQFTALILNLLLAYIIAKHSNGTLKSYKEVFMITCVNDVLLSGITLLCQPMNFYDGKVSVMYANGFVADAHPSAVYWLMIVYSTCVMANTAFLPVTFLYRYCNICRGGTDGILKKLVILPAALSVASFFTASMMLRNDEEFQAHAVAVVEKKTGVHNYRDHLSPRVFGMFNRAGELRIYPQLILSGVVLVATYFAIIWSEYKVMRKLRLLRPSMRSSTRRLHTDVHNALVALGICPMLTMLIPRSLFLVGFAFHIDMGLVPPFLGILITSVTLLNPITTCYFVRPFRFYLLRSFCCGERPDSSHSSSLPTITNKVQDSQVTVGRLTNI